MARQRLASIRTVTTGDSVVVRLARPERYNALDAESLAEVAVVLENLPDRHLPLVIEGEGAVFSLGADVRELANFSPEAAATYSRLGQQAVAALEDWPGVTIANLRGYALGTGLELALGCDVLVAEPTVRLGLPGLAWALVPCLGGLRRLHERVGAEVSRDLFLRGVMLDGPAALAAGLVNRLMTGDGDLERLIGEVGELIPGAVRALRELRLERHGPIDAGEQAEQFAQAFATGECQRRLRTLL